METPMSPIALLLLLQVSASPGAAVIDDAGTITVTATRLEDLAAAAKRCEQNGCAPREDIAVSVAYGSTLFDAGNYLDAKRWLAAAVGRNKHAARAEPLAVAQLYTAQATLAAHEGDQRTARRATWASRNIITDSPGLPAVPRLNAEFRLADWQLRAGETNEAQVRFAAIAADAAAAGYPAVAGLAELRRAIALHALNRRSDSRALLEALAARTGPGTDDVRRAALALAARLAFITGDPAAADGYAARLAGIAPGPEPLLVSSPPMPSPVSNLQNDGFSPVVIDTGPRGAYVLGLRWVDIGFWIKPDGSVDDAAILRGSRRLEWARPLLGTISGRRYSASTIAGAGSYHVERYTLTADYGTPIGSLVRRRADHPRFEMMEMSAEPPAPDPVSERRDAPDVRPSSALP
jgi:hypothetical protein